VTKILHEKILVEDKLKAVENNINGLEDRIRKTIQIQYDKKIESLQAENEELKYQFKQFKELY